MTDSVILRMPTAPEYSYLELKLEFDSFDQLNGKIDELHNGLLAKLSAAVSTACQLARLDPSAMAQIEAWEASRGPSRPMPSGPPEADSHEAGLRHAADMVKRSLGATEVPDYSAPPWENSDGTDSRPAPPWAAPSSPPTPVVTSSVPFDDDF